MFNIYYNSLIEELLHKIVLIENNLHCIEIQKCTLNSLTIKNNVFSSKKNFRDYISKKLNNELNSLIDEINSLSLLIIHYTYVIEKNIYRNSLSKDFITAKLYRLYEKSIDYKNSISDIIQINNYICTHHNKKCYGYKSNYYSKNNKIYPTTSNKIRKYESPEYKDISGNWDMITGKLVLIQDGANVSGYYTYDDGLIEGSITGNTLTSTWSETPSYAPPKDSGIIEATIEDNLLEGQWGYANRDPSNLWYARRVSKDFSQNCYRYRFVHSSPNLPTLNLPNDTLEYNMVSKYYYPNTCESSINIPIVIDDSTYEKTVTLSPGYSYTLFIKGNLEDIEIETQIDTIENIAMKNI
jgi:hypothetical protein